MTNRNDLVFLAGRTAFERIQDAGLQPEDVAVVAGASGAAKWLIISELDKAIFSQWLKDRKTPLPLFGTSIGSWKLAAAAQDDPSSAFETLAQSYIHQHYEGKVTPKQVTAEGWRILDSYLPQEKVKEILSHPVMRFNLCAVRCKGLTATRKIFLQLLALGISSLANRISPRLLSLLFERTLFHDSRDPSSLFDKSEFPLQRVPLDEKNFRRALMASGSIPLAMEGVTGIPGAHEGVYRDGGILDYHPSSFYPGEGTGIVLYPHFYSRLIPGWFDKSLPWRSPRPEHLKNMLLLAPSQEFISRLPYGSIPDRKDFVRFHGRDEERIAFWNEARREGERLADDFMESVLSGSIRTKVMPLEEQWPQ